MNMVFFGVTWLKDWLGETKSDPPLSGICIAVHWVEMPEQNYCAFTPGTRLMDLVQSWNIVVCLHFAVTIKPKV